MPRTVLLVHYNILALTHQVPWSLNSRARTLSLCQKGVFTNCPAAMSASRTTSVTQARHKERRGLTVCRWQKTGGRAVTVTDQWKLTLLPMQGVPAAEYFPFRQLQRF